MGDCTSIRVSSEVIPHQPWLPSNSSRPPPSTSAGPSARSPPSSGPSSLAPWARSWPSPSLRSETTLATAHDRRFPSHTRSPRVPERFRRATTTRCESVQQKDDEKSKRIHHQLVPAFSGVYSLPARGQLHGDGVYISESIESRANRKDLSISGKRLSGEAEYCLPH